MRNITCWHTGELFHCVYLAESRYISEEVCGDPI